MVRWNSFVADPAPADAPPVRGLHEIDNHVHRVRVEHDANTLLIHLSDEDGNGWTCLAVDRATRRWAVAQGRAQQATAAQAYRALYPATSAPER